MTRDAVTQAASRAAQRDLSYGSPENLRRRKRLEGDLGAWLKWYLAAAFPLPWAEFHVVAISRIQGAIENAGQQAVGIPRGSGKTTLAKGALLWALLTGKKRYGLLIGATGKKGTAMLADIKTWLRFNERLLADYPEVCVPIRALQGVPHRARAQTAFRKNTLIEWGVDRLRLPSSPRVCASGRTVPAVSCSAIVDCDGITGDIRGHSFATADGRVLRPDLALCDDPQTRESAKSREQTNDREALIKADVAASAGPDSPMTVLAQVTIIYRNDLADRLLNTRDWRPVKTQMVLGWPKNLEMWETAYNAERLAGIEAEDKGSRAAAFIAVNRAALYDGASVSWPERYDPGEVDGVQHAMNLYLRFGRSAFMSEYQLAPEDETQPILELPRDAVARRVTGGKRREAPENAAAAFGMVDFNDDGLRWGIGCASNDGAITVVDYGIFPGGGEVLIPDKASEKVALLRGLSGLDKLLSSITILRGQDPMKLDLVLLDCGGQLMQTIFDWLGSAAKRSGLPWMASRGWGSRTYRPSKNRIGRPGEGWHMARWPGKGKVLVHDADMWRMRQQRGWLIPIAAPDSIALFGEAGQTHEVFADGVTAERLTAFVETDQGPMYRWQLLPGARNDWGDVATGLFVAASRLGMVAGNAAEEGGGRPARQVPGKKEARVLIRKPGGRR